LELVPKQAKLERQVSNTAAVGNFPLISTVKHQSSKAKQLHVNFEDKNDSDNEIGQPPKTTKSKFSFSRSKKRSSSNDKSKELQSQEVHQMEQDLLAIEMKI